MLGLSITGAIIGVGFSSGREITTFFLSHGKLSVLFCLLVGFLFTLFSYIIFKLTDKKRKIESFNVKNGFKTAKTSKINDFEKIYTVVIFICQIAICSAMFAGLGVAIRSVFPSLKMDLLIKVVALLLCTLYLLYFKSGVYVANFVLSLVMIVAMFVMFIVLTMKGNVTNVGGKLFDMGLVYMPLLYVGMNILTAEPLLAEIGEGLNSKKERISTSFFIGLFISVTLLVALLALMLFGQGGEMPMLTLASKVGDWFAYLYGFVMVACILTTLISTGYGASKILSTNIKYKASVVVSMALGFTLSFLGFGKIIDIVYPIIGGMCLVFIIIKYFIYR